MSVNTFSKQTEIDLKKCEHFLKANSNIYNVRSKLLATDRTYVHSYGRFLSFDMLLNPQMHLKSKQTV